MKNIILLIFSIIFAIEVYGQGEAPLLLRGQAQTSQQVGAFLRVPNLQVTRLTGATGLIETGNKNILANPGFEHQTYNTGWTTSGTATFSEETSTVLFGVKSFEISATSQTFSLSQDSTLYQAQYADGIQGVASVWVNNTNPAVEICSRQAGADIDCIEAETDGSWHFYSIPMILGGTSNGIVIKGASGTGTTFVDEAFVGVLDIQKSQVANISNWETFTPVGLWTTNTTYTGAKRRVGDSLEVTITVNLAGAPNASVFQITIPDSLSIDENKLTKGFGSESPVGYAYLLDSSTSGNNEVATVWAANANGVRILTRAGASMGQATPFTWASGDYLKMTFLVPIVGWRTSESSLSSFCQDIKDCTEGFTARVDSTGAITSQNTNWLSGCSYSGGLHTCNIVAGIFNVIPSCNANLDNDNNDDAGTKIATISTSQITVRTRDAGTQFARNITIQCFKQGADFINAKNPVIVGTFKGVNTSPNTDRPKLCSFYIGSPPSTACSSNPCTVSNQVGGCVDNVARNTNGEYRSNWVSGYWAQTPSCVAINTSSAQDRITISSISGTSFIDFRSRVDSSGTTTDVLVNVICHGF